MTNFDDLVTRAKQRHIQVMSRNSSPDRLIINDWRWMNAQDGASKAEFMRELEHFMATVPDDATFDGTEISFSFQRQETDEEYAIRMQEVERERERRYQKYLELKKEFEGGHTQ